MRIESLKSMSLAPYKRKVHNKKLSSYMREKKKVTNSIEKKREVLPRFELGSLDSKSKVLTATP